MRKILLAGTAAVFVPAGAVAANSDSAVNTLDMIRLGQHWTG